MPLITHDLNGMCKEAEQPTLSLGSPLMGAEGDTLEPQRI